jgi:hypothetical protein
LDVPSSLLLLELDTPKPPVAVQAISYPIDRREACNWQGRHGLNVVGVVEHIGVAPTFDSLVNYLVSCNGPEVSATFVIGGDYVGQWAMLVGSGIVTNTKLPIDKEKFLRAANHAGIVSLPNRNPMPDWGNPNWWTIGKEHVGYPGQIWTDAMVANDRACNAYIMSILGNKAFSHVLGHCDFDPVSRANCPGPTFPWDRIYRRSVATDQDALATIGQIPSTRLGSLKPGDHDGYNALFQEYATQ